MTSTSALDLDSLWRHSLDEVMQTVQSPAQRQWLAATHPVGFSDDTVILASPHAFAREWLDTRCGDRIRSALSASAGRDLSVVITVQPRPETFDDSAASTQHPAAGATDRPDHRHPATAEGDPSAVFTGADLNDSTTTPDYPADPYALLDAPEAQDSLKGALASGQLSDPATTASRPADSHRSSAHRFTGDLHGQPLQAPGRPDGPTVTISERRTAPEEVHDTGTQLNPKYSFDDFVIGSSNRFAHAAATAVAEAPAKSYNPLFIYGGAGLGKTHLLHAIGHYVRSLYPRLQVRYVTTEQFTNDFINAIRHDRITVFQRTFRQTDVLLIDDIQFLERAERTQEEFFHTFNALHNAEKQIVISSDRPPKQIAQLEDRLRSRFEWGLMTDVQPPDLETRIAILRKKCESDRLGVDQDVLGLIASKVQSNIRELEGALIRVSAFSSLQRAPADLHMAEIVLKDLFPDDREQDVSVQLIMDEVAEYFSLTIDDLCSPSRSRQLVTARQIAMYLSRELTDLSLPRIGKAFGGRDHTTVMHAKQKIATLMQERRAIYDQIQELTNRVKTRARRP
ncbi:MAG: chromosomal replication initiator protein DnaA [Nitriliruptoraceae bacterium]